MRNDDARSVVRLPKRSSFDRSTSVVLTRKRPVFVDEVKDVFIEEEEIISVRHVRAQQILSFVLIPLLLFQPFVRVYAAEEAVATVDVSQESPTSTTPPGETLPSDSSDNTPSSGEVVLALETSDNTGEVTETSSVDIVTAADPIATSSSDEITLPSSAEDDVASTTDSIQGGDQGTTTDATSSSGEVPVFDTATDTLPQEDETVLLVEETISTSIEATEPPAINIDQLMQEREQVLREQLRKQVEEEFTKGCTTLDGTGYYCLKSDVPKFSGDLSPSREVGEVTADVSTEGSDKEIFVMRGGIRVQLTNNDREDAFPAKDLAGSRVVWQGMVDGRWQIFTALMASDTPEVVQLTHGGENNFNPRTEGGVIAWQAWINNNWEVVLVKPHQGTPRSIEDRLPDEQIALGVDGAWDVQRVTTDVAHDMFPSVANGVVTWQKAENNGWSIYAYGIDSQVVTKISSGNAKSERPRFAVVWDEDGADGRKLMSYDLATGETNDLTQRAREAPYQRPYIPEAPVAAGDQAAFVVAPSVASRGDGGGDDGASGDGADGDGDDGLVPGATSTDETIVSLDSVVQATSSLSVVDLTQVLDGSAVHVVDLSQTQTDSSGEVNIP